MSAVMACGTMSNSHRSRPESIRGDKRKRDTEGRKQGEIKHDRDIFENLQPPSQRTLFLLSSGAVQCR